MVTRHTLTVAPVATILWIMLALPSSAQLLAPDGQSAQRAICIPPPEAHAHIIALPYLIRSTVLENSRVDVKVVVSPTGSVLSATPFSGNPKWYEQAAALALTWRFVPFELGGSAIYATFSYVVHIVPPEKRPEEHISFPEINDWNSLRITLQRTACRGLCPAYKLTVFGDGRVLFSGYSVDYGGEYHGRVSPEVVRQLVDLFKGADYFNLFDRYGKAFDVPDFITSISFDGKTKSVVDEVGYYDGMPDVVSKVEDGIDRLAGPKVWAKEAETHRQRW